MKPLPAIKVSNATGNAKPQEISGVVTVGAESAALLSKKLGREVKVGEQFDIGVLAMYHPNPIRRLWGSLKIWRSSHLFSKPLK